MRSLLLLFQRRLFSHSRLFYLSLCRVGGLLRSDFRSHGTLFGLDVIDELQRRLFAAHDRVLAVDEDALGLSTIQSIKLESQRRRRPVGRSRGRRRGTPDVSARIKQQTVNVQLQCDEATLAYFLELCRAEGRTLVLDRLTVTEPARPGEGATVKATLSGVAFVAEEEGK